MTAYYVYSGAGGAANGTSWANAYTKLATAYSGKAAGDIFYVAHDHSETTAGVTLDSPGTHTSFVRVVCADRSGSVPPVAADLRATAVIECSANNNMFISGCTHYDGIIFNCGSSSGGSSANMVIADNTNSNSLRFDNCALNIARSGNSGQIFLAGTGGQNNVYVELNNTTVGFTASGQGISKVSMLRWRNTPSAITGTVPTSLFQAMGTGVIDCEGVDLNAYTGTLATTSSSAPGMQWRFVDCKLNGSVVKATANLATILGNGSHEVHFVRTGSSGVNYNIFKQHKTGALNEELTVVRTGGASDGTTPLAWKIDTSATSSYFTPFECPLIAVWNDTTGSSKTATVEGVWGGGAVPNDDEVWVEVRYLSDASSPQGTIVKDARTILGTAAGQTSSSETWGGSTTKFKLNVSFTAQQKGWVYARVMCAKPSSTFYIDPLITLT